MTAILAAQEVHKRFGATRALRGASLALDAGEVHALVGENGAGKSTLIKILSGVYLPDSGRLLLDARPLVLGSPREAFAAGVAVIQQELRVVPALSVAENVMLGHLPVRGLLRTVDRRRMRRLALEALDRLDLALDPDAPVASLSFAERQSVMIARALSRRARALILDEPTAALEEREVRSLFATLEKLRSEGVAVLYVSHRLDEIVAIADRSSVMRDGKIVKEFRRGEFSAADLARHMTGREPSAASALPGRAASEPLLESPEDSRLALRRGEIVGIAGLIGAGTTAILRRLFGADGKGAPLRLRGGAVRFRHPHEAVRAGLGLLPGERGAALVSSHSVRDNIALANLSRFSRFGRMDDRALDRAVRELIEALDIRPPDPHLPVRALSGGNQQKVAFARWLAARIEVFLLDDPTRGMDIAAKAQVHRLMREFAAQGGAILFSSSELQEIVQLACAALAVRKGAITARLERGSEMSEQALREAISA